MLIFKSSSGMTVGQQLIGLREGRPGGGTKGVTYSSRTNTMYLPEGRIEYEYTG